MGNKMRERHSLPSPRVVRSDTELAHYRGSHFMGQLAHGWGRSGAELVLLQGEPPSC